MRRLLFTTMSLLVLGAVFAAEAWAPPIWGIPDVRVSAGCAVYGQAITLAGGGFAPGSNVNVSAPFGHYVGAPLPERWIPAVDVVADGQGRIEATLQLPSHGSPDWRYQARTVMATGPSYRDGQELSSFDQLVVASKRICNRLEPSS